VKTEPYGNVMAVRPFLTCTPLEKCFIVYARSNVPGTVTVLSCFVRALLIAIYQHSYTGYLSLLYSKERKIKIIIIIIIFSAVGPEP
jgi:hypothetical protein